MLRSSRAAYRPRCPGVTGQGRSQLLVEILAGGVPPALLAAGGGGGGGRPRPVEILAGGVPPALLAYGMRV